jgi:predicted DNA-binding transcriptional regulator AlpA
LGTKAVGWIEHEIDEWIATQIKKSRKATRKGQS